MSIVVSSVEMIVNSITSDQSIARSASDKLLSQMLESLITYTAITCVAIGSKNEFPFNVNFDLSEILLSSRLFSVLSAFLVKIEDGTMPVATFYQSLHIDVKLR